MIDSIETMKAIVSKLDNKERVCYVRFGDGDYIFMHKSSLGKQVGGNNKCICFDEARIKMIKSYNVVEEDYLVGSVVGLNERNSTNNNVTGPFRNNPEIKHPETIYSAIAIQECFLDNKNMFKSFLDHISNKKSLYINHYREPIVNNMFGISQFVKVEQYNATSQHKEVLDSVRSLDPNSFDQIILSCGFLSRVIFKDLYDLFPSKNIFDIGSVSDMCIINTPSYQNIKVRGHIRSNNTKIVNNSKEYNKYCMDIKK